MLRIFSFLYSVSYLPKFIIAVGKCEDFIFSLFTGNLGLRVVIDIEELFFCFNNSGTFMGECDSFELW